MIYIIHYEREGFIPGMQNWFNTKSQSMQCNTIIDRRGGGTPNNHLSRCFKKHVLKSKIPA